MPFNVSNSRHTPAKGLLTRSLGVEDNQDLVVGLDENGTLLIRVEPTDRRLKRGEVLPELRIDARQAWSGKDTKTPTETEDTVREILTALFHTLPTAQMNENDQKSWTKLQGWIWGRLRTLLTDDQEYARLLGKIRPQPTKEDDRHSSYDH